MARAPRRRNQAPNNPVAEAMIADMDLTQRYQAGLLKELSQSYEREINRVDEAILLIGSIYHWWWKFMQAHYDHPSNDRDAGIDAAIAETQLLFGDRSLSFNDWWVQTGRDLFAEQGNLPLIRVMNMDRDFGPDKFPKSITLEIPLTIPRDGIVHQLDKLLAVCHPGPDLKRHARSTAHVKIHPKTRYRLNGMARLLVMWTKIQSEPVWLDRPDEEWWPIAREFNLGDGYEYDDYPNLPRDIKRELGRSARRIYSQANSIMNNAVRGDFPNG